MLIGIDASKVTTLQKTGTENYSDFLIKAISRVDKENKYRLYLNTDKKIDLIKQDNFQEVMIPFPRFWTQYRLAKELFVSPPDLLFVPAHTIPLIRPRILKTIVTIHDLGAQYLKQYHQFPQRLYLNSSTEYVLKHATHVIAVSEATKKEIVSNFHREEKTVSVIHEGYNREIYDFAKLKAKSEKVKAIINKYKLKKPYLLFVGTIQPRKNLTRLIQAFALLKDKNLFLVLVGKKGWLYQDIFREPQRLGISTRVKFLDYVEDKDLPYLYHGAHCFTFPSLCEGFGIPLLEAMACGCPIITSNLSSMPEVVHEAAILVDPYNVFSIKEGIEKVIGDSELRQKLVSKGLERVKNFSWEKAAEKTIKVFEKLKENH